MDDKDKVIPVIFLDVSRTFGGRIPSNYEYYFRNYNLKISQKKFVLICKLLKRKGFLSDKSQTEVRQKSDAPTLILSSLKEKDCKGRKKEEVFQISSEDREKLIRDAIPDFRKKVSM